MDSNTVDLVATDPPFKKGRDFHATPDSLAKGASFQDRWSWDDDVDGKWVDKLEDDFPAVMNVIDGSTNSYGYDMGAFLCFMGVRLLEMHRVLKDTGSMYLHCDPTASHYLKELMDAVFGHENFRNEIIWKRSGAHSDSKQGGGKFGRIHDVLLFYVKSEKYCWNPVYTPYSDDYLKKFYRFVEHETGRRYGLAPIDGPGGGTKGNPRYKVMGITRYWRFSEKRMQELIMQGRVIQTKPGTVPKQKQYLDEKKGVELQSIWMDIPKIGPQAKERVGYPTQKPLNLYERIIKASSNEGDVVLDPFAGCATTCVAAEKLNRQWIGIDIWDKAHETVIERLRSEGILAGPGERRQDVLITKGELTYVKRPFKRTDGGSEAVPFLETKMKAFDDREDDPYSNKEKKCMLLEQYGPCCQGCGIELHERYLELDHKEPRSAGGSNLIRNRILLCGPCNKLKRDLYTLVWLRRENTKLGYMINEKVLAPLKG